MSQTTRPSATLAVTFLVSQLLLTGTGPQQAGAAGPIQVQKTNDADVDGVYGDSEVAPSAGASVSFRVDVTNQGMLPVTVVSMTDAYPGATIEICPALTGKQIASGATATCQFDLAGYAPQRGQQRQNTVTVTVEDTTQEQATATDTTLVRGPIPGMICSSCPPPCEDSSRALLGYEVRGSLSWSFNRASAPTSVRRGALDALRRAADRVRRSTNDCGLSDRVSARPSFGGLTSRRAAIRPDGTCGRPDGVSVVDFGRFDGPAGLTCAHVRDGIVREVDIRLNKRFRWTLRPGRASCSNRYDVEGLMVHEFGHAFGLGHVAPPSENLTMFPWLVPCTAVYRSLGLGDVRGLRALY